MQEFIYELKSRNETLYYFGLICMVAAIIFLILTRFTTTQVYNINAWIKPFKFAISIFLYSWTMAWFCHYLPSFNTQFFNWSIIILLGFEIIYIAIQAGRGQLSHYNISTPFYGVMYIFMAVAASLVAIYTAYVGYLFFQNSFSDLPEYYVWGIRLGLLIFVIFSFEGFVMGSRLSHTIGGADGGEGLPILNWSTKFGDPRVSHFIGMHAMQVLPILAFYVLKDTKLTILVGVFYGLLSVFTLVQAIQGKPFFKSRLHSKNEIIR